MVPHACAARALALLAGLLLLAAAPPGAGGEEDGNGGRNAHRGLGLPFSDLELAADLRLIEGPRMLGDQFPYLATVPTGQAPARSTGLVPSNLAAALRQAPQQGGDVPAGIRTGQAAIEAVRLFLAGPLVEDEATAERILAEGRRLAQELKHLEVQVTGNRPQTFVATATPLDQDRSQHPVEAWEVSLVAFEMDRVLQLVQVKARVTAAGALTIDRLPLVRGPMTSWQTAVMGEYTEEMAREQREMVAEAALARARYASALKPARSLDAFWAVGRVLRRMDEVRDVFGEPDRDMGSGLHLWTYDLPDATRIVFGDGGRGIVYVRHVARPDADSTAPRVLGVIYTNG